MNEPIKSGAALAQNYGKLLRAWKKHFNETPPIQIKQIDRKKADSTISENMNKNWEQQKRNWEQLIKGGHD